MQKKRDLIDLFYYGVVVLFWLSLVLGSSLLISVLSSVTLTLILLPSLSFFLNIEYAVLTKYVYSPSSLGSATYLLFVTYASKVYLPSESTE